MDFFEGVVRGQDGLGLRLFCDAILFWTTAEFGGFSYGRRVSGGPAKVFPVVAVVTDEVRDLAKGLVRDGVLEGHGEDSRFGRWVERNVCGVFLFVLVCVVAFVWCVCGAKQGRCGAGFLLF